MKFKSAKEAAEAYIKRGWQVVPLEAGKKECKDDSWLKLIFKPEDFYPDDNIGIRSTGGLIILDLDSPEAVAVAKFILPKTGMIWGRPGKPSSKWGYLSTFPKTVALKEHLEKNGQDTTTTIVEVRSAHQDMAPPSKHPNGELLEWEVFEDPAMIDALIIMKATRMVATAAQIGKYYAPPGGRHDWCLALSGTLKQLGLTLEEANIIMKAAAFVAGDGKVDDRLTEVRTTYAKGDDDAIKGRKALTTASSKDFVKTLYNLWNTGSNSTAFILDDKGERILANNQENIRRALYKLKAELSYNQFSQKPIIKYNGSSGTLQDSIRNHIWLKIDEKFHFRPSPDYFDVVIQEEAQLNSFHPVRDYLATLVWDGTPRLDTWLIRHAAAADNEYVKAVSAIVLIAAVRRVMSPGCKFDELLVLESNQGMLKSSALRALCPVEDWFSDDLPLNVDSKQIIERTLGKWLIEVGELAGMSAARAEHLKASLSRQVDGPVRLAYARLAVEQPRQWVAVGTTNLHAYLQDSTGNRRFWPVRVGRFNIEGIILERNQLWAEATHREAQGESIRLDPKLYPLAAIQQERRRQGDPWENIITEHFGDSNDTYRLTYDEIWDKLGIPIGQRDERGQRRILSIMQAQGFRRITVSKGGKKIKGWGRDKVHDTPDMFNEDDK